MMLLHDVIPHHHHHPDNKPHQHATAGEGEIPGEPIPYSHAGHAEYSLVLSSRIGTPSLTEALPDFFVLDDNGFLRFFIDPLLISKPSPPPVVVIKYFYSLITGLRAPPNYR
jgi:hypothetical protein